MKGYTIKRSPFDRSIISDIDKMEYRYLTDIICVLEDLHLDFEHVTVDVEMGPYKKTIDMGIYVKELGIYLPLTYEMASSIHKNNKVSFLSLISKGLQPLRNDKLFRSGYDIFTNKKI